ncbi:siderophore-interacting protein [Komagataeibacter diospyri]|uniref:Siderophore-interacting iron utilization protein n=1 Tax=Komagataeibacter diospyri TaxID=1932662 RepID=A0A4P5NLL6_9PROT|nr:siderophore-interacting protein [Komagataeibacter diospyri]GCE82263.1 siderophore-interacting iron utilization protein [Komagataeibacter diospyri]
MQVISRPPTRIRHPLRLRMMQIARTEQASPHIRRIIFSGNELEGFTTSAADDHVKLFFPLPGHDRPVLPHLGPDGRNPAREQDPAVIMRDYTVRHFDPDAGELTIEFVLHGDGPAATWAAQAQPGHWLGIGGPRGSFIIPDDYAAYLLMGDETALSAIARRLAELPSTAHVTVMVEVADARDERPLKTSSHATVHWLHRNGVPAGHSMVLPDALAAFSLTSPDTHAWIGAEIGIARHLRDLLLTEKGLPRDQVRAAGYWRLGAADGGARVED